MTHDVFISHSSVDKNVANAVCAGLESAGIRCWIAPRDILASERWPKAIASAIPDSKVMVLIFSRHSNLSEDAKAELILAREMNVIIVPFKIDDVEEEGEMRYLLAGLHWLDAMNPPTKAQIHRLVEMVDAIIQAHPEAGHRPSPLEEPLEEEKPPERETPKPTGLSRITPRLKWISAAVIAAMILALALYFIVAAVTSGIKVPNVVAMSEADARTALEKAGFKCSVEQKEDDSAETGKVLAQNPTADGEAEEGQEVTITVAVKGKVSCPNVVGVGQDQSLEIIRQASLNYSLVQSPTADQSQHGVIISQQPPAGTELDKGASVALVVGVYQASAVQPASQSAQQPTTTRSQTPTQETPAQQEPPAKQTPPPTQDTPPI